MIWFRCSISYPQVNMERPSGLNKDYANPSSYSKSSALYVLNFYSKSILKTFNFDCWLVEKETLSVDVTKNICLVNLDLSLQVLQKPLVYGRYCRKFWKLKWVQKNVWIFADSLQPTMTKISLICKTYKPL